MQDEMTHPLFPIVAESLADNIPLLDQVVDSNELTSDSSISPQSLEPERLNLLRKQFETEMNKKIRKRLQETERHLQKEMKNQLDSLFKQINNPKQ